MIIFGTRGVTYNHKAGDFCCPVCGSDGTYKHKRARRFFTLYFIPCIPLDLLGEYIECQACQGTFDLAVLEYDAKGDREAFEAEFHKAIRTTMIQMVIADGVVDDAEIETVQEIYQGLANIALDGIALKEECSNTTPRDIADVVGELGHTLNQRGKELVLQAAVQVAASDGDFAEEEQELALAIGKALEMTSASTKGVIAEALGT